MSSTVPSALRAEAALMTFLVEHEALWEDEERAIRAAVDVVRRYSVRSR